MLDIIVYYLFIGLIFNVALALHSFYRANDEGYVIVPHAMIFFLTIFSWPYTLWGMIASFGKESDNGN